MQPPGPTVASVIDHGVRVFLKVLRFRNDRAFQRLPYREVKNFLASLQLFVTLELSPAAISKFSIT
jgi:hypothetical protein